MDFHTLARGKGVVLKMGLNEWIAQLRTLRRVGVKVEMLKGAKEATIIFEKGKITIRNLMVVKVADKYTIAGDAKEEGSIGKEEVR